MILIISTISLYITTIMAIQPLEDGRGNRLYPHMASQPLEDGQGHRLPPDPVTFLPDNQSLSTLKDENSVLEDSTALTQEPVNKYELKKDIDKTTSLVGSSSNATISEKENPILWLYARLGYTTNNKNTSGSVDTVRKTVETTDSGVDVIREKLSNGGKENESVLKPGEEKHFSDNEQLSGIEENKPVSVSDANCYGSICTYVLLGSSTYYFYHVSYRF